MKTLLILRHAKSSWKHQELADHDRPLNKRGKQDAPRVGELLQGADLIPELILSSTAVRARATAAAVAQASGYEGEIRLTRDFYLGGPEDYLAVLRGLADTCTRVMVVGHNPGLEALLEALTAEDEALPAGAMAHVALRLDSWRRLDDETEAELVAVWRPRELAPRSRSETKRR